MKTAEKIFNLVAKNCDNFEQAMFFVIYYLMENKIEFNKKPGFHLGMSCGMHEFHFYDDSILTISELGWVTSDEETAEIAKGFSFPHDSRCGVHTYADMMRACYEK